MDVKCRDPLHDLRGEKGKKVGNVADDEEKGEDGEGDTMCGDGGGCSKHDIICSATASDMMDSDRRLGKEREKKVPHDFSYHLPQQPLKIAFPLLYQDLIFTAALKCKGSENQGVRRCRPLGRRPRGGLRPRVRGEGAELNGERRRERRKRTLKVRISLCRIRSDRGSS